MMPEVVTYSFLAAAAGSDAAAQVVQVVGALLVLAGFAAAQFGWLTPQSRLYLVLNLIGSIILTVLAARDRQYGFLLLESVWALVSAWGLVALARGQAPTAAH
jgi:hypothetical protein